MHFIYQKLFKLFGLVETECILYPRGRRCLSYIIICPCSVSWHPHEPIDESGNFQVVELTCRDFFIFGHKKIYLFAGQCSLCKKVSFFLESYVHFSQNSWDEFIKLSRLRR